MALQDAIISLAQIRQRHFAFAAYLRQWGEHMQTVVDMVDKVLMDIDNENTITEVRNEVRTFMDQFPLYPELG
jgi:archaellum biogenesis protein FlaJ (TadC family)